MGVSKELLTQISDYEKQGYSPDEIVDGLGQSEKYPDIAKKVTGYRGEKYDADSILKGLRSSPIGRDVTKELGGTPEWAGKYPTLYGILGASKEVARFAAETAAIVGGGMVGAATPLPGGMAVGAGLAFAGTRMLESYLEGERAAEPEAGSKPAFGRRLAGAATKAAGEFGVGGVIAATGGVPGKLVEKAYAPVVKTLRAAGETIEPTAGIVKTMAGPVQKTLTNHISETLTTEVSDYLKTVNAMGYEPTSAEVVGAKARGVSLIEGMLTYLPGSAGIMQRARLGNLEKLTSLRKQLLDKGAGDAAIENVGVRIKNEAEALVKSVTKGRKEISQEHVDAMVGKLVNDLNATTSGAAREGALGDATTSFFDRTGQVPTPSSAGKTVQDMMAAKKTKMFQDASGHLEATNQALKDHKIPYGISTQIADMLLEKELASDIPDAKVIRILRPYASPEEGMPQDLKTLIDNLQSKEPKIAGRMKEAFDAMQEDIGGEEKSWRTLDLTRSRLLALARKENVLEGTPYAGARGTTTEAGRAYTMLADGIFDDMTAYAKTNAPEHFTDFVNGKRMWREAKELFDDDALGIMSKNPEDLFTTGAVINPGEVANIRKMKQILGEEGFKPFKELLTRKVIAYDKNGVLDVKKTTANINKYGETFTEVFSPEERKSFTDLVSKGKEVETAFEKSEALKDIWSLDKEGNIIVGATRKKMEVNKGKLAEHFTPDELTEVDKVVGRMENANIKNIARNKSDAMKFLSTLASSGMQPQNVVNAIVRPNNTINIRYMKRLLGPDLTKEVESKFIEEFLMKNNEFGYYLPQKAAKVFNQYEKTMKQLMDPQTYKEISNLMKLNRHAAMLEKLAANPSQTGQTLIAFETGKDIVRSVSFMLASAGAGYYGAQHHPYATVISALVVGFGPYGLAKLYLSPAGRKYLSVGYTVPAGTKEGMALLTKMAAIAGVNIGKADEKEYKTPEDVGKAYQSGEIDRTAASKILRDKHGME